MAVLLHTQFDSYVQIAISRFPPEFNVLQNTHGTDTVTVIRKSHCSVGTNGCSNVLFLFAEALKAEDGKNAEDMRRLMA